MSTPFLNTRSSILLLSSALVVACLAGCVATPGSSTTYTPDQIPPGQAVVMVLVTNPPAEKAPDALALQIGGLKTVQLEVHAVNLIYLPVGEYTFRLPNVRQEYSNANTYFSLKSGEVQRLALRGKAEGAEEPGNSFQRPKARLNPPYKLLPITEDGLNKVASALELPLQRVR